MQNIKYFFIIFFLLSVFILMGCFEQKKDLTSDEFVSIASKYGYKTFEELGKSLDIDEVTVDKLKKLYDNLFDVKNSKNKTSLIYRDKNKFSFIRFVEFEDEKYASEVMNNCDNIKKKKELGQLPLNIKNGSFITDFEEILVGRAKRVILTGTSSNNSKKRKMFIIYSKVGNNVVQIATTGKEKEEIDKMLDELGF